MSLRTVLEHDVGLTWIVDEPMTRTSHALVDRGRVWLVDVVDQDGIVDRAAALGEPAAVLQLLDRHNRDCAAVARRLGVPHITLPKELPGTPLQPFPIVTTPFWKEVGLWWAQRRVLVVPEAVGTSRIFTGGASAVGVHFMLRLTPPRRLLRYTPEHLLVGHGPPVHGPAAAEGLSEAIARSRRDLPRVLVQLPHALRS